MNEDHSGYKNPLSTKTPTMTVAGIMTWLDLEIEYLKEKAKTESEPVQIILMGTWLHLEVMKAQLGDYTMKMLDEDK